MKNKWKYGRQLAIAFFFFSLSSCERKEEHKHIPTNKISDLDGLAQPSNQTVFSEVKTVSPIQLSVTPLLNATGVISYDPLLINTISARFGGRIEKLYLRFNFENISKGQRIMDIYSPEILTAQQNLIYLLNNSGNDVALINLSKQKLQLLGLTNDQLNQIETTQKPLNPLPVYSPYSGHIHDIGTSNSAAVPSNTNTGMSSSMNSQSTTSPQIQIENIPSSKTSALSIKEGMYLQSGQPVFSVYNINQVWAILNIYPQDAISIAVGNPVTIIAESNPTKLISSTINYLEPVTGLNASAIKARVYLNNSENLHLKIGTLLTANITAAKINGLWLPRSAVINLGNEQIVFLKSENYFVTKTIKTGFVSDSLIQIISGLNRDDSVATNAYYLVDSESFIQTNDTSKETKNKKQEVKIKK